MAPVPSSSNIEAMETTFTSPEGVPTPLKAASTTTRRFVPELVETSTKTSRRVPPAPINTQNLSNGLFSSEPTVMEDTTNIETKKARRRSKEKFSQEWDEWASQAEQDFSSRKQKDASRDARKRARRFSPHSQNTSDTRSPPPPPENTPTVDFSHNPLFAEIERATSPTTRRRPSWASMRSSHSFVVPDLDPIESSESEPSSPISPMLYRIPSRHRRSSTWTVQTRESADEEFSGYLLELAAKAAEKQLREQALAAFPNDDEHEHVDHFIDRDADDEDLEKTYVKPRRESSVSETNHDMLEMRRHWERLDKQHEEKKRLEAQSNTLEPKPQCWGNPAALLNEPKAQELLGETQQDSVLELMQKGARPPMLGDDIVFPRCASPEPAHFDSTQGCDAVKIATIYLSEQCQAAERGEGLWCGSNVPSTRPSLYCSDKHNSGANSRSPSPGGLWGGWCAKSGLTPPRGPTGILTPEIKTDYPPSPAPTPARYLLPPTPPPSNPDFACIDQKLAVEAAIEEDFGDSFVTQVYNYLSLGYPTIGRMFDEDLSKISHIPVAELRQDDHLPATRGYIRLGEDKTDADIKEETCMRWRALRLYVKEWARQHPNMASETAGTGTAVRRGSWAQ